MSRTRQFAVIVHERSKTDQTLDLLVHGEEGVGLEHTLVLAPVRTSRRAGAESADDHSAFIRRTLAGRTVVAHPLSSVADVLENLGALPKKLLIDFDELISAIAPAKARSPLTRIALELGFPVDDAAAHQPARLVAWIFLALMESLESYDDETMRRVAIHASGSGWSCASLLTELAIARDGLAIGTRPRAFSSHELAFMVNRSRPEPLKPTGVRDPIAAERVDQAIGNRGELGAIVPSYEYRPSQLGLSQAVAGALNGDGWLMAEAGTGTGKSLAYLLPAALHAQTRGEPVVISTNTRALQDQLLSKDIPEVSRLLESWSDAPLTTAVLKGRGNYLCLRRWFAAERQPPHSPTDASMRAKVSLWLPTTETGDRSELALRGDEASAFSDVSAEGEACNAARCPFQQRNQCFLYRARREAEAAHVVVVNHALLLSDLGEGGSILPNFDRLILDEAHHLESQATSHFGFSVSEAMIWDAIDRVVRQDGPSLTGAIGDASALLSRLAQTPNALLLSEAMRKRTQKSLDLCLDVRGKSATLFGAVRKLCSGQAPMDVGFGQELRVTPAVRRQQEWAAIEVQGDTLALSMREIEAELAWHLATVEEHAPKEDEPPETDFWAEVEAGLMATLQAIVDLSVKLAEIILNPGADGIYWIALASGSERTSVHAAPLDVAPLLRERVYAPMRTVVMTSATLTTDDRFDFMKTRLGFGDADELELASPFDYASAAMLYLVDDIPEPAAPGYQQGVEDALLGLGSALQGRTLALFTSHGAVRASYRAINAKLAESGVDVLAQGVHGTPGQLIERLRSTSHTMVLGTATFWEGVDVVGPALSALVIAKLPFSVPSDPVFAARSEQVDDPFTGYAVPQAVLKFKQGFGRLIRSGRDRGLCVVLDRRVLSKRYGASFVQSLPPCTVNVGGRFDVAAAALAWLGEARTEAEIG